MNLKFGFHKKRGVGRIGFLALFFLITLSLCFVPANAWADTGAEEQIILTWSQDPTTSQAITWLSPESDANTIKYMKKTDYDGDFAEASSAAAARENFADCEQYRFSVVLTNLTPDTSYVYRVGSEDAWSGVRSFRTAGGGDDFTFLYLGDVQEGYDDWGDLIENIYADNPQIRFGLIGGDLITGGRDCTEWSEFLTAATGVFSQIPMMPAKGNHDKELFTDFFALPDNGPAGYTDIFYSFDYGDAHFTVLDSSNITTPAIKQWLQADLQATDKKWKFAMFHHPPYQNFDDGKPVDDALREHWVPIFEENQVDMVFVGHQHVYMRTFPIYQGQVMENSYGVVYVLGNSGSKFYNLGPGYPYIARQEHGNNYQVLELDGDVLTMTSRYPDGSLLETYVLDKEQMQGDGEEENSPITMELSQTSAAIGDQITASGQTAPGAWVPIKIIDEAGEIVFFDSDKADAAGNYSIDFIIPDDVSGVLTVIVGEGSDVAREDIYIGAKITLVLSKTIANAGDSIIASGETASGAWVPIKIIDDQGNIVLFDSHKADAAGKYSISFIIPDDVSGVLTVIVGEGSNVARQDIHIEWGITLELSKTAALAGESVVASGKTAPEAWVPIKIVDEWGNLLLFDAGKADAEGDYSIEFVIPGDVSGVLTVIVGEGSDIARQDINVGKEISFSLSDSSAFAGDTITGTGRTLPDTMVPFQIVDEEGNVLLSGIAQADPQGDFNFELPIPENVSGDMEVMVGEEGRIASQSLYVVEDFSLNLSKERVVAGAVIEASGTALPGDQVPYVLEDEKGNILLSGAETVDAEGDYNFDILIPENAEGILTITAGKGRHVIYKTITIKGIDECFIATAAFGSKYTWPVALLRDFRDQHLLTNSTGTAFVKLYYQLSPPIADMIAADQGLKTLVKVLLAPIIAIVYLVYHPALMAMLLVLLAGLLMYRLRIRKRPGLV